MTINVKTKTLCQAYLIPSSCTPKIDYMSLLKEETDSRLLLHVYSTRGVCFLATLPIAMNKKDEALGEKISG